MNTCATVFTAPPKIFPAAGTTGPKIADWFLVRVGRCADADAVSTNLPELAWQWQEPFPN